MVRKLERGTSTSMDIIHSVAGRVPHVLAWLWLLARMDGCMLWEDTLLLAISLGRNPSEATVLVKIVYRW